MSVKYTWWGLLGTILLISACGGEGDDPFIEAPASMSSPGSSSASPVPNTTESTSNTTATDVQDDTTTPTVAAPPTPPRTGFDEDGHLLGVSAVPYNPCANDPQCPDLQLKRAMMKARPRP